MLFITALFFSFLLPQANPLFISGTVFDSTAKPVADAHVHLEEPTARQQWDGETKEEGTSIDDDSVSDTSSEHSIATEEKSTLDSNTTITNKGVGQKVDLLLMRMPESSNRDLIDAIAVEFIFLNSKASRNRLIKKLIDVPRNRQDVLPYYSRLIATLSRYIPDIGKTVVEVVLTTISCLTCS